MLTLGTLALLSGMRAGLAVQTKGLGTLHVLVDEAFDGRPGPASEGNTPALRRRCLVSLAKKVSNVISHEQGRRSATRTSALGA